jgi:hypothetical protein
MLWCTFGRARLSRSNPRRQRTDVSTGLQCRSQRRRAWGDLSVSQQNQTLPGSRSRCHHFAAFQRHGSSREGGRLCRLTCCRSALPISRLPGLRQMRSASYDARSLRLRMQAITAFRLLYSFRASLILAAFGAQISISGCAAYPAGGYGGLGYVRPDYGPGYAYSPGFGYSDFGVIGTGFGRGPRLHHLDGDFDDRHFGPDVDHRFHGDHHFHGQAMIGELRRLGMFHHPPEGFRGSGAHPGFGAVGGFHGRGANPPPAPHPGAAHPTFNR